MGHISQKPTNTSTRILALYEWPYIWAMYQASRETNVEIVGILTNKTGENSIRTISDHL
jgi:hypothetical protein